LQHCCSISIVQHCLSSSTVIAAALFSSTQAQVWQGRRLQGRPVHSAGAAGLLASVEGVHCTCNWIQQFHLTVCVEFVMCGTQCDILALTVVLPTQEHAPLKAASKRNHCWQLSLQNSPFAEKAMALCSKRC
jgi:hypothetical protein